MVQQVKDPALSSSSLSSCCGVDSIPWPGNFHMWQAQVPKKKKKKKKKKPQKEENTNAKVLKTKLKAEPWPTENKLRHAIKT